jgi:GNAT superfamily N-acetyltransferase
MQIDYLMNHQEFLPNLAGLHYEEWAYLRPGESLEARTSRLRSYMGRQGIPTAVVALDQRARLGSAMLVAKDLDTHPHLSPWLAGVYVHPKFRRHGIATALVSRIIDEARSLGTRTLYLYTASAEQFFSRLGWSVMETGVFHDTPVAVMSYEIAV